MSILTPQYRFNKINEIPLSFFKEHRITGIILDVDNTLTTHGNPTPAQGVVEWIKLMRQNDLKLMIVSNNNKSRVSPFADKIGVPFVSMGFKPLTHGISRAILQMGLPKERIAIIGDQIFTDILGGNLKGITTILVSPFELEHGWFFALKRRLEDKILKK